MMPNNSFQNFPQGWETKTLGEVCEITMGQSPKGEQVFSHNKVSDCHSDLECNEREESQKDSTLKDISATPQYDKMTSSCHSEGDKPEESHIADSHRDISHFSNAQYDKENNLPQGWETKTLGEVCEITMGQSPKGEQVFSHNKVSDCHSDLECNEREESQKDSTLKDISATPQYDKMTSSCHSEGDKPEESHIADSNRDISHFSNTQYDKENNLPQGWEVKTLGEIFLIERGGSPRPIKEYLTTDSDGINWIKIGDTKNITKYITETAQKIKPEGKKHSRFVEIGDLILSNSMSFGKPYIMKTTGCIHDGWVVFKQSKKVIDEEFCYYVLSSSEIYAQFDKLATGSTVKNLNIERIKQIQIPLPPLETQKQIVEILDSKFAALENLERETNASLEKLQRLKSLLLNLAFKGELIC